jgi:uroporphyrinogen decarboxylase
MIANSAAAGVPPGTPGIAAATRNFNRFVAESPGRLALPIAVYPGLAVTGDTVRDVVTNPRAQFDAQVVLHERYRAPFLLSAMDLSAEAEAFGCTLHLSDNEIPAVTGRLVTTMEQAQRLALPGPGDKRTAVYLEVVTRLRQRFPDKIVLAGCIGPFSLAARLVGVSEALELTLTEPGLMHAVVARSAEFLAAYARAFQQAGADGIIMAEPAAGLLSPRGLAQYSSAYIRQLASGFDPSAFTFILHNCAARLAHLPAILDSGLKTFHFGAPMDIPTALTKVPGEVVLCGNLDPTGVFVQLSGPEIAGRTASLLHAVQGHRNFVISSGCDVPPSAPLASLDAFYQAVSAC